MVNESWSRAGFTPPSRPDRIRGGVNPALPVDEPEGRTVPGFMVNRPRTASSRAHRGKQGGFCEPTDCGGCTEKWRLRAGKPGWRRSGAARRPDVPPGAPPSSLCSDDEDDRLEPAECYGAGNGGSGVKLQNSHGNSGGPMPGIVPTYGLPGRPSDAATASSRVFFENPFNSMT